MTDTTYPRHVLAWNEDEVDLFWLQGDGALTVHRDVDRYWNANDHRDYGWVVDARVDLPQEPPEPEIEPGWYLVGLRGASRVRAAEIDGGGRWRHLDGMPAHGKDDDWRIVAPLTSEQVAAIDKHNESETK